MTTRAHHLDHNAGAPVDPRVLDEFARLEREFPGNPASAHQLGRRARACVEDARMRIANALAVDVDDVVFCSGGTEANNLAVLGQGDRDLPVLLGTVEHPSVAEPAKRRGVAWWRIDAAGRAVVEPPAQRVGLVCLVHAQSEVGTIQPIVEAANLADDMKVPLHVDAAQTVGRVSLVEVASRATSLSISPHKFGGLRGSGVLVVRDAERALRSMMLGGAQEHGLRAGTVSPSMAMATALAIELAIAEQPARSERMLEQKRAFLGALSATALAHRVLTPEESLPNTAMVAFAHVEGRNLLPALDLAGVCASHGSACSSGSPQPPAVLLAMGLSDADARACVRFSFGSGNSAKDAAIAAEAVATIVMHAQKKF